MRSVYCVIYDAFVSVLCDVAYFVSAINDAHSKLFIMYKDVIVVLNKNRF